MRNGYILKGNVAVDSTRGRGGSRLYPWHGGSWPRSWRVWRFALSKRSGPSTLLMANKVVLTWHSELDKGAENQSYRTKNHTDRPGGFLLVEALETEVRHINAAGNFGSVPSTPTKNKSRELLSALCVLGMLAAVFVH